MHVSTEEDLIHIHPALRALAVDVSTLTPDPKNARKHSRRNLDAIKASLERFGMRASIVVQRQDETLVVRAGNGRLAVARELGWKYLPAIVFDEDDDEAVAFAIADNRTADLAEWDFEVLSDTLKDLGSKGFEFEPLGFEIAEVDGLFGDRLWSDEPNEGLEKIRQAGKDIRAQNHKMSFKGDQVIELRALYEEHKTEDDETPLDFVLRVLKETLSNGD